MAKYELVLILDPFLEEADIAAEQEKAKEQIKRRGGEVTNVEVWGKRRMAYEIKKKIEGHYTLFSFEGNLTGANLAELERTFRLSERVLREMVTRIPAPPKPRKVKVKKPKPQQTETQYGGGRPYQGETHSAGQAGAVHNQSRQG